MRSCCTAANSRCRGTPWSEPAGAAGGADRRSWTEWVGKSTLVAAVTGQATVSVGRVRLFGHDVPSSICRECAFANGARWCCQPEIGPRPARRPRLSRDVALQTLPRRIQSFRRQTRAADVALDRLGLAHLAVRRPSSLSGGERQRVALAAGARGDGPGLVIADEPTVSWMRSAPIRSTTACAITPSAWVRRCSS